MNKAACFAAAVGCVLTSPALAAPINEPPPPGAAFSLTGLPLTTAYTQYGFTFVASSTTTNLTFALRDDPSYLYLDDISLTRLGSTGNLLTNGGFESGPVDAASPIGWTYLNQFDSYDTGYVSNAGAHTGTNAYADGSVQAYDAITQAVSTVLGETYAVSFFARASNNSVATTYQPVSTNGSVTSALGNGIGIFVYAGNGIPTLGAGATPEPGTWATMIVGFGLTGFALRRRRKVTTRVSLPEPT